jgi:hypothetical protein
MWTQVSCWSSHNFVWLSLALPAPQPVPVTQPSSASTAACACHRAHTSSCQIQNHPNRPLDFTSSKWMNYCSVVSLAMGWCFWGLLSSLSLTSETWVLTIRKGFSCSKDVLKTLKWQENVTHQICWPVNTLTSIDKIRTYSLRIFSIKLIYLHYRKLE